MPVNMSANCVKMVRHLEQNNTGKMNKDGELIVNIKDIGLAIMSFAGQSQITRDRYFQLLKQLKFIEQVPKSSGDFRINVQKAMDYSYNVLGKI